VAYQTAAVACRLYRVDIKVSRICVALYYELLLCKALTVTMIVFLVRSRDELVMSLPYC